MVFIAQRSPTPALFAQPGCRDDLSAPERFLYFLYQDSEILSVGSRWVGDLEKTIFGAGCFWGVEAAFRRMDGVVDAAVGYAGGALRNPTYEDVCGGKTGHAEVVEVTFDPARITYKRLLEVFWACHDPTQLNRQGWDVGTQYRSVLFHHSPEQESQARDSMAALQASGQIRGEIVTEISKVTDFWRAEEYHQRYIEKQGRS
jgi:peptide-methionine (S)-S-oxide reductase